MVKISNHVTIKLSQRAHFSEFRRFACLLLEEGVRPDTVTWHLDENDELFDTLELAEFRGSPQRSFSVPERFLSLAKTLICHADLSAYGLLYRLLFRLQTESHVFALKSDDDVACAFAMEKAVRRDYHHMQAFLRFRQEDTAFNEFTAWYEPDHYIVPMIAPFFQRRFADMNWHILTPKGQAHFMDGKLDVCFTPATNPHHCDALEDLWQTYYSSTFNPARIKVKTMVQHMPKRFWSNLKETERIPDLIHSSARRVADMAEQRAKPAPAFHERLQQKRVANMQPVSALTDLAQLNMALQKCQFCALARCATQAVCGEGPATADLMIIGEQPGDKEDLSGKPFIGPAGKFLDQQLYQANIQRERCYVTSAVKHFKYEMRGKLRMHKTANRSEIDHCRWWLKQEIAIVKPKLILALGLSAFYALTQKRAKMHEIRGTLLKIENLPPIFATYHPSYFLRRHHQLDQDLAFFVDDLRRAGNLAA